MSSSNLPKQEISGTQLLRETALSALPATIVRATGPLDAVLPWVIEFRVVGTASTIQARVTEHMIIGRSDAERGIRPEVDLTLYNGYNLGVSRQHAAIMAVDSSIRVKDTGSANGTRLNGVPLEAHRAYRLRHGDELALGRLRLQVSFAVVPLVSEALRPGSAPAPTLGSGQRVLIVEDDADVAAVFGLILEQAGFKVLIVNSATRALAALAAGSPQALIIDLMLPDMNGLDLVRYVRCREAGGDVPLVVISGQTGGFQMSQALKAGADVFLGKPIGVDELLGAFTALLPQMAAQRPTVSTRPPSPHQ